MDKLTRGGHKIGIDDIDLNADHKVSLYEAHIYTLRTATSSDLSRSTSEIYLEKWEPWYLRWMSYVSPGNDIYAEISREVAMKNSLLKEGRNIEVRQLQGKRRQFQHEMDELEKRKKKGRGSVKKIQEKIQEELFLLWPALKNAYTVNYLDFIKNDLQDAVSYITRHSDYKKLKELQDLKESIHDEMLTLKRQMAQLDKILRLRKISRVKSFFQKHASDREKEEYQQLLQCEKQAL